MPKLLDMGGEEFPFWSFLEGAILKETALISFLITLGGFLLWFSIVIAICIAWIVFL